MVPEIIDGEQWYSSPIHIILADDHLNATYDLTKNLNSHDGKNETEIGIDGYAYQAGQSYFKNGTILVFIDSAGNLTVDIEGVGNMKEDPSDSDKTIELHYTGKGTVLN